MRYWAHDPLLGDPVRTGLRLGAVAMSDLMPTPGRDEYPAAILAMLPPGTVLPPMPRCRDCGAVATTQWQRKATPAETEQHWAALEAHIREQPDLLGHGNAEYTADRTQPVTKAVHGCHEHAVDDTVMLHAADCGGHQACQCEGTATDD